MAQLKWTEFGKVNLDYVLGIGGFDLERYIDLLAANKYFLEHMGANGRAFSGSSYTSMGYDTWMLNNGYHRIRQSSEVAQLPANIWLGMLLLERSKDIYRMKGLLSVQGMNERFVFQGVHDIFQGSPDRLWGPNEPRTNKIVFIGKNMDAQELEKGFKGCLL
ncbi:uncharacterized protein [Pyrus communis]|uniref:uncharacterized protein n=1 Tax=Pyrus communis TaxID=23211 RepID=UPI0035C10AB0